MENNIYKTLSSSSASLKMPESFKGAKPKGGKSACLEESKEVEGKRMDRQTGRQVDDRSRIHALSRG